MCLLVKLAAQPTLDPKASLPRFPSLHPPHVICDGTNRALEPWSGIGRLIFRAAHSAVVPAQGPSFLLPPSGRTQLLLLSWTHHVTSRPRGHATASYTSQYKRTVSGGTDDTTIRLNTDLADLLSISLSLSLFPHSISSILFNSLIWRLLPLLCPSFVVCLSLFSFLGLLHAAYGAGNSPCPEQSMPCAERCRTTFDPFPWH